MSLMSRFKLLATMGRGLSRGLTEADADRDPIELFRTWWTEAEESGLFLPEAVSLATATPDGRPSARMVLLKMVDERGFVVFTNYASRKATEMEENPRAALCAHWGVLERQVRVEGPVERTDRAESEAYFRTRPRGSRVGAWASRQSADLPSRKALEERYREIEDRYGNEEVPLPDFWGGYRIVPDRIEFWQGRPSRLHDRLVFERDAPDEPWTTRRLYP